MKDFPQSEANFLISGAVGNLELLTMSHKEDVSPRSTVAIICHPHPLHGGTMRNKVVSTLARAFRDLGLRTVQFNFRGIGESEGSFAEGVGEREDLLAVIHWVQQICPGNDILLAGFSFGAAMSVHVATQIAVAQLVSISPPVPRFDLLTIPPVRCPWLVVQGDADDIVLWEDVSKWVETLQPHPQLIRMAGAGHFFHGRLLELRELLVGALV